MRKILVMIPFILFSLESRGQISIEANIGRPVGLYEGISNISYGIHFEYELKQLNDYGFGLVTGLQHNKVNRDDADVSFIQLAGLANYKLSRIFTLEVSAGYGLVLSPPGVNGGFYYRPALGYDVWNTLRLKVFFSDFLFGGASISNFGAGFMLRI